MREQVCHIQIDPPKVSGDRVRLEGRLKTPSLPDRHLFFEFTCPNPSQAEANVRPFVLAFLPVAMRLGLPLACEEPIDRVSRDNLQLWQAAYAAWLPTRLTQVELRIPVSDCKRARTGRGALTAFSGGSDSCYTALTYDRAGDCPLTAGLMIHGFDIPHDDHAGFTGAWDNTRALLQSYGLEAYQMRTNIREPRLPKLCWEREVHGIWLAAGLACLEPWFDGLVIPSSYPSRRARIPCGSNALTDPLLGTAGVPVIHHRPELSRSEKFPLLARNVPATERMRVCFLNDQHDRNCGRCFKCVTAQVLLWSYGVNQPAAFPVRATVEAISNIPVEDRDAARLVGVLREVRTAAAAAKLTQILTPLDAAIVRAEAGVCREAARRRWRARVSRWLGLAR